MSCHTPQEYLLDEYKAGKKLTLFDSCPCGKKVFEHKVLKAIEKETESKVCILCKGNMGIKCTNCNGNKFFVICNECSHHKSDHTDLSCIYECSEGMCSKGFFEQKNCESCIGTGIMRCPVCNK